MRPPRIRSCRFTLTVLLLSGCGWGDEEAPEEHPLPPASIGSPTEDEGTSTPASRTRSAGDALELRLSSGDRFPLLKTVDQSLVRDDGSNQPIGHTHLELLMAITVEEVRESGQKLLAVQYDRVGYRHDIAGERVEYDSRTPQSPLPPEAVPYRGLTGNGFSFWLGPDHRIIDLVGFDAFLERCLSDIPPALRSDAMLNLSVSSEHDGIANFIDDSIGLLPSRAANRDGSQLGDSWTIERKTTRPIPLRIRQVCTLEELTDETAEISIAGTISPSASFSPADATSSGVKVIVTGGRSFGTCRIRRSTGLPIDSRIEQTLGMLVELPGGAAYRQRKTTVTTVRAFPQQGEATTGDAASSAAVPEPIRIDR